MAAASVCAHGPGTWHWSRTLPLAVVLAIALGVGAGIAGVLLPAFGWWPALGRSVLSLDVWRELLAWPGLSRAVALTLWTGLVATAASVALSLLIVAALHRTRAYRLLAGALAPLLAIPHAAAAFGLAFLIAPSGWIARVLSPGLTGWEVPPDLLVVSDPVGLSLVAGLILKEVPFLLLMIMAALSRAEFGRSAVVAQGFGHGRIAAWMLVVLPRIYPMLRLPVLAVLAYSLGAVEMAMILGPTRPAPLAVMIVDWAAQPDLGLRFRAAAGAVLLLCVTLAALLIWTLLERGISLAGRHAAVQGWRFRSLDPPLLAAGRLTAGLVTLGLLIAVVGLGLWSVAGLWRFPDLVPDQLTLRAWTSQAPALSRALSATLALAALSVFPCLIVVILLLEAESRSGAGSWGMRILWLPLLVPQVAFLPGVQVLALGAGQDVGLGIVAAAHALFVLPYVWIVLAGPWRSWDSRAGLVARSLGAGPWRVLWAVRLPMLLRPLAAAAAVGVAVSVAQYLPTLLLGGGRIATLTTEAVALSSGGNRRVIGVWAFAQALVPLAGFALALLVPAFLLRNRRGLAA